METTNNGEMANLVVELDLDVSGMDLSEIKAEVLTRIKSDYEAAKNQMTKKLFDGWKRHNKGMVNWYLKNFKDNPDETIIIKPDPEKGPSLVKEEKTASKVVKKVTKKNPEKKKPEKKVTKKTPEKKPTKKKEVKKVKKVIKKKPATAPAKKVEKKLDEFGFAIGSKRNHFANFIRKPHKMAEVKKASWNPTHGTFYEAFNDLKKRGLAKHDSTGKMIIVIRKKKAKK